MNGKEYLFTQMAMVEIGKRIEALDIEGFLKCITRAQKAPPEGAPPTFIARLGALKVFAETLHKAQHASKQLLVPTSKTLPPAIKAVRPGVEL